MFFRGVSCPPYIVWGAGLQIWKPILVSYNCHIWPDKDSYSNRPGSCLIAKSALTPCAGLRSGWLGRTSSFEWTEPIDPGWPKLSRKGIGVNTPIASPRAPCIMLRHVVQSSSTNAICLHVISNWLKHWPSKCASILVSTESSRPRL